jgi:hypothetical protein
MLIIKAKLTNIYVKINSKSGGFYVEKKREEDSFYRKIWNAQTKSE